MANWRYRVYCNEKLLEMVQLSNIWHDCKTFVDMPMKSNPDEILKKFNALCIKHDKVEMSQLQQFLDDNFYKPGNELEEIVPSDWNERPNVVQKLKNPDTRQWAADLNSIWKSLCRKVKPEVLKCPERTSLITVPNPFIVPGDRFQEIYYWDSFWIINGLLLCDMSNTVKGMLENMIRLVNQYGFVPNGCRIYYTKRSQPPFLIPMVNSYYAYSQDLQFIQHNIEALEREYQFWTNHRTVEYKDPRTGRVYELCVYGSDSDGPRPESYRQDVATAAHFTNDQKAKLYRSITAACESGWDFSVRWFKDCQNMETICAERIAPVDLNSLMAWNEQLLAQFCNLLGLKDKARYYTQRHQARVDMLSQVMWSEEEGCWFDVDIDDKQQRQMFFLSNFTPLFTGSYDKSQQGHFASKVVACLKKSGALNYKGGIPNSMTSHPGQQWDFPSSWSPSVHMLIEGLSLTGMPEAEDLAKELANKWLSCNYAGWKKHGAMFEKYSVLEAGSPGGGGEYNVQRGFGWTNGVVLMLLDKYGDQVTINTDVS